MVHYTASELYNYIHHCSFIEAIPLCASLFPHDGTVVVDSKCLAITEDKHPRVPTASITAIADVRLRYDLWLAKIPWKRSETSMMTSSMLRGKCARTCSKWASLGSLWCKEANLEESNRENITNICASMVSDGITVKLNKGHYEKSF